MATMRTTDTLPIWGLDCRTKSFVLALCLDDADVADVGAFEDAPDGVGPSRAVWRRNYLHSACRAETPLARAVQDFLDLRYAGAVIAVRGAHELDLRQEVRRAIADRRLHEFPAFLWALATDRRDGVRRLGQELVCEAFLAACALIRGVPARLAR